MTNAPTAAAEAKAAATPKKSEVTVTGRTSKGKSFSRVYSVDLHGKNFMALAEEAVEKFNGTIS